MIKKKYLSFSDKNRRSWLQVIFHTFYKLNCVNVIVVTSLRDSIWESRKKVNLIVELYMKKKL